MEQAKEQLVPSTVRKEPPSPNGADAADQKRQRVTEPELEDVEIQPLQLPKSTSLFNEELETAEQGGLTKSVFQVSERDVGIRSYVGKHANKIEAIIKQRFSDFLVNEVGQDGKILHLKDIGKPKEPVLERPAAPAASETKAEENVAKAESSEAKQAKPKAVKAEEVPAPVELEHKAETPVEPEVDVSSLPPSLHFDANPQWPTTHTSTLHALGLLSTEAIVALRALLLEGSTPPRVSDAGWGSRAPRVEGAPTMTEEEQEMSSLDAIVPNGASSSGGRGGRGRGQGRDRGRGRGGRGGRGGGRFGGNDDRPVDHREVVSEIIPSKEQRGTFHKTIRELFGGKFESEARDVPGEEGSRIVVKWSTGATRRFGDSKDGKPAAARGPKPPQHPPYIHFTLQKSNRDTQDSLQHISRLIRVPIKDLSFAGTKDKRGVTVQKIALKRGRLTLTQIWKSVNGVTQGWRTEDAVTKERGDRGVRIGDLEYSKIYLELGMLKGNHFVITLRNVKAESKEAIDTAMESLRDHGFINYYGMQRFGTSSVATHTIGLALLQSRWQDAIDLILSVRQGEHPDCTRARLSWQREKDHKKALELMPRRSVAERCLWEFWAKGKDLTDRVGALATIPRPLRTMYVHAYQSYIWNAVVSERIKLSADKPIVGDLVYDEAVDEDEPAQPASNAHGKRTWKAPRQAKVKVLTEQEINDSKYTIFDVVMPLPGFDVEYPEGRVAEIIDEVMKADGLDPTKMRREQREYSLPGSYRKIIHLPSHLTWTHLQYTDPDINLIQSDEDKILNTNPAAVSDPDGKFWALQIGLTLGTSAYATMALREVTRTETSGWHQTALMEKGEDQDFKGSKGDDGAGDGEGEGEGELDGDEDEEVARGEDQ